MSCMKESHASIVFMSNKAVDVIEWRRVVVFYGAALKSILVANSSLSCICSVDWPGAISAVLNGRLV